MPFLGMGKVLRTALIKEAARTQGAQANDSAVRKRDPG